MSNKPTHELVMISGEGKAATWTRIAGLWPTKDNKGLTGEIPAGVSVSGRFGIFERKDKEAGEG